MEAYAGNQSIWLPEGAVCYSNKDEAGIDKETYEMPCREDMDGDVHCICGSTFLRQLRRHCLSDSGGSFSSAAARVNCQVADASGALKRGQELCGNYHLCTKSRLFIATTQFLC